MNKNSESITKEIVKIFLLFILFYWIILYVWLEVQSYYNILLSDSMIGLFTWYFDFNILSSEVDGMVFQYFIEDTKIFYMEEGKSLIMNMGIKLNPMDISYNIPMTLSAVMAIIVVKGQKKIDYLLLIYVSILLILLHFITIYFLLLTGTTKLVLQNSMFMEFFQKEHLVCYDEYQYIFKFLREYAIRFEPFLMMFYVLGKIGR